MLTAGVAHLSREMPVCQQPPLLLARLFLPAGTLSPASPAHHPICLISDSVIPKPETHLTEKLETMQGNKQGSSLGIFRNLSQGQHLKKTSLLGIVLGGRTFQGPSLPSLVPRKEGGAGGEEEEEVEEKEEEEQKKQLNN